MIKITFKPKKKVPIALIKKINQISCRVKIDNENGYLVVEDYQTSSEFEKILNVIDSNYDILAVEIDNIDMNKDNVDEPKNVKKAPSKRKRKVSKKKPVKKIGKEERVIEEIIGTKLKTLGKTKPDLEAINSFLLDIGMSKIINNEKQPLMGDVFEIAFKVDKINYENIVNEMVKLQRWEKMNKDNLKYTIKGIFKSWLINYPRLEEECPKISIVPMLKVFVRHFN